MLYRVHINSKASLFFLASAAAAAVCSTGPLGAFVARGYHEHTTSAPVSKEQKRNVAFI